MTEFRRGDVVTPHRFSTAQTKASVKPGIMYNVADARLFKRGDKYHYGIILSQIEAQWMFSPLIKGYWWGDLFKLVYRPPPNFLELLLKGQLK